MESTAVVKAFALLEAAAESPQGLGLGELASLVGLNKPTAHRLLKTLAGLGYVEKCSFGHYRQTSQVRRLVGGADDQRLLGAAAARLEKLHNDTQETVNLGVLRSGRVVYLQVLESTQPLRRVATPNSVDPFYSTALGRAIVAYLPDAQRDLLLRSGPWEACTPRTLVEPDQLRAELERVAKQGFAIEIDQTDLGVTCIGAPIFEQRTPVGAVSLSIPSARFGNSVSGALVKAVCETARRIEKELGRSKELAR